MRTHITITAMLIASAVIFSGCCMSGRCPYCQTHLAYQENPIKYDMKVTCYECKGTFFVDNNCRTCGLEGQYNEELVAAVVEKRAKTSSYAPSYAPSYTPAPLSFPTKTYYGLDGQRRVNPPPMPVYQQRPQMNLYEEWKYLNGYK